MSGLVPTDHRVALLRDVASRDVWQRSNDVTWRKRTEIPFDDRGPDERYSARIEEAEAAGWVVLNRLPSGSKRWDLTDLGRRVLDACTPPKPEPTSPLAYALRKAFTPAELCRMLADIGDAHGWDNEPGDAWDRFETALNQAAKEN